MGTWGIILLVVLVMSAIMIGFGLFFAIIGPKKINYIFGYRTPMSMKNLDTWRFGNAYAGKYMWRTGIVLLIGSLITLFAIMGNNNETTIRTVGIIIILVHAVMVFGTILMTEIALRRVFDSQGNPK